jgi:hypothetical protein
LRVSRPSASACVRKCAGRRERECLDLVAAGEVVCRQGCVYVCVCGGGGAEAKGCRGASAGRGCVFAEVPREASVTPGTLCVPCLADPCSRCTRVCIRLPSSHSSDCLEAMSSAPSKRPPAPPAAASTIPVPPHFPRITPLHRPCRNLTLRIMRLPPTRLSRSRVDISQVLLIQRPPRRFLSLQD